MTFYRGSTIVLERPGSPETATDPSLQLVTREMHVGGVNADATIVMIENPLLDRLYGFLLVQHLRVNKLDMELLEAFHIRATEHAVRETTRYKEVRISKGFDEGPYNFVVTDTEIVLPAGNRRSYEMCFISPEEYGSFLERLGKRRDIENILKEVYELMAKKVELFSLMGGRLVIPDDYASLRLDRRQ